MKYIGTRPSKKAIKNLMDKIHTKKASNVGWMETSKMVR
jgi:hypothetical protein